MSGTLTWVRVPGPEVSGTLTRVRVPGPEVPGTLTWVRVPGPELSVPGPELGLWPLWAPVFFFEAVYFYPQS